LAGRKPRPPLPIIQASTTIIASSSAPQHHKYPQKNRGVDEKKSVSFSRRLVSDIFYVERIDERLINDLFYSEKDIIGFQIDHLRSAEQKASHRQLSHSKSDGAVLSLTNRGEEEESLNESPKSKTSRKLNKKKGCGKKAPETSCDHRYSNDNAKEYTPRLHNESSKAKAQGKDASAMDKCTSILSKDEKDLANKYAMSRTRSSSNKDSTGASKTKRQEDILLKTSMKLCQTTERQARTLDGSNVSLKPSTQDRLMLTAMQWKERMARTVSKNLVPLSTEVEPKEKKKL
jgi:hypothetical protein